MARKERGKGKIVGDIFIPANLKIRACFKAEVLQTRTEKITITRWLIGQVTNHQNCKCGNAELSRKHAIQCTASHIVLNTLDPDIAIDRNAEMNIIDQVFEQVYQRRDRSIYQTLTQIISNIYRDCLGFTRKENGYWENAEPTTQHLQNNRRRHANSHYQTNRNKKPRITKYFSKPAVAPDFSTHVHPVQPSNPEDTQLNNSQSLPSQLEQRSLTTGSFQAHFEDRPLTSNVLSNSSLAFLEQRRSRVREHQISRRSRRQNLIIHEVTTRTTHFQFNESTWNGYFWTHESRNDMLWTDYSFYQFEPP
jgi:hypothetical protein